MRTVQLSGAELLHSSQALLLLLLLLFESYGIFVYFTRNKSSQTGLVVRFSLATIEELFERVRLQLKLLTRHGKGSFKKTFSKLNFSLSPLLVTNIYLTAVITGSHNERDKTLRFGNKIAIVHQTRAAPTTAR